MILTNLEVDDFWAKCDVQQKILLYLCTKALIPKWKVTELNAVCNKMFLLYESQTGRSYNEPNFPSFGPVTGFAAVHVTWISWGRADRYPFHSLGGILFCCTSTILCHGKSHISSRPPCLEYLSLRRIWLRIGTWDEIRYSNTLHSPFKFQASLI